MTTTREVECPYCHAMVNTAQITDSVLTFHDGDTIGGENYYCDYNSPLVCDKCEKPIILDVEVDIVLTPRAYDEDNLTDWLKEDAHYKELRARYASKTTLDGGKP